MKLKNLVYFMLCLLLFSCEKGGNHDVPDALENYVDKAALHYEIIVDEYLYVADTVYVVFVWDDSPPVNYMFDMQGKQIGSRKVTGLRNDAFVFAYYGAFKAEEWSYAVRLRHIYREHEWLV